MQLARFATAEDPTPRVGLIEADGVRPIGPEGGRLSDVLHAEDPSRVISAWLDDATMSPLAHDAVRLLAPIDDQEVWGAGVTYERSKTAREEESEQAATFYDLVYRAERPELFFKATPNRVAGPGQPIRVRSDSRWCVPEPELTLVVSPSLRIVGYTVGNDVSARDIEGVNPLYLPQAKMYDACCALGPVVTLCDALPSVHDTEIRLEIERDGNVIVRDATSTSRITRKFEDLVRWLSRDQRFPNGFFLMTGTGVIPPDDFTLRAGDLVRITIDGIGTLSNPVVQDPSV